MRRSGGWRWLAGVLVVLAPLVLSGCADDEPPAAANFAPLSYGYLPPLRLNVGAVEVDPSGFTPADGDVSAQSPVLPLDALRQMARDRLVASGANGRAVFSVETASITEAGDTLSGRLRVRLDVYASDGTRAAFAEASVARSVSGVDEGNGLRAVLYGLTRDMLNDMNVELEFQMRRSLGDWLQGRASGTAPPPAPVQQQPLAAPR